MGARGGGKWRSSPAGNPAGDGLSQPTQPPSPMYSVPSPIARENQGKMAIALPPPSKAYNLKNLRLESNSGGEVRRSKLSFSPDAS